MYNSMEQMLYNEYGIQVQSLQQIPAGWSASAWKVHSECGDYFLKVYDKHKPSTRNWIARIDSYMPVVLWLHENTKLQKKMTFWSSRWSSVLLFLKLNLKAINSFRKKLQKKA